MMSPKESNLDQVVLDNLSKITFNSRRQSFKPKPLNAVLFASDDTTSAPASTEPSNLSPYKKQCNSLNQFDCSSPLQDALAREREREKYIIQLHSKRVLLDDSFLPFGEVLKGQGQKGSPEGSRTLLSFTEGNSLMTARVSVKKLCYQSLRFGVVEHHARVSKCMAGIGGKPWYIAVVASTLLPSEAGSADTPRLITPRTPIFKQWRNLECPPENRFDDAKNAHSLRRSNGKKQKPSESEEFSDSKDAPELTSKADANSTCARTISFSHGVTKSMADDELPEHESVPDPFIIENNSQIILRAKSGHVYNIPKSSHVSVFRVDAGCALKLHPGTWYAGPLFDEPEMDFLFVDSADTDEQDTTLYSFSRREGIVFDVDVGEKAPSCKSSRIYSLSNLQIQS